MDIINFSQNWNGRLFMDNFGDVRLRDDAKFFLENKMNLYYKGYHLGVVSIAALRIFKFKQITDVLAYQVCGKPAPYLAKILKDLYSKEIEMTPETELIHLVLHYSYRDCKVTAPVLQDWWRTKQDQFNYSIHTNS
jgi:hypothetical protein